MKHSSLRLAFSGLVLLVFIANETFSQEGQIIWEENFNQLDTTVWNIVEGNGCPDQCGWGNGELEYYSKNNVRVEEIPGEPGNYALVLEAKKEAVGNNAFTSGKISSAKKTAIKYGMVEMRIKVPDDLSKGLWPAAWMLGTNLPANGWPSCGEIDIMEMGQSATFRSNNGFANSTENDIVGANLLFYSKDACSGTNTNCAASIAYDNYYCQPYRGSSPLTERFLIYRMYWDDEYIRFTVEDNGNVQNLYTGPFPIGTESSEFRKPFYFVLNLAVGGTFTDAANASQVTADLPGKMYIDYIRVRKWNGKGEVFTNNEMMANAGADQTLSSGEQVTLNAAGSYGPIAQYVWTLKNNVIATGINPTVQLNAGFNEITLTVTDAHGNSNSDKVVINIGNSEIGEVLWKEDFNTLDTTKWNKIVGDGCAEGLCGWGNNELEYYHNNNVYTEEIENDPGNYALVLEAKKEPMGQSAFTSGKVTTENKLAIKYGVIEVRMKVPNLEKGLWPAAWLLGVNHATEGWPACGEIDIMEMGQSKAAREKEGFFGSSNNFVAANLLWYSSKACTSDNLTCAASIAYDAYYNTPYTPSTGMNNRFMTYRMYWDESKIRFTVIDNGTEHDLYTNPFPISSNEDAFRKPFYFLLDLAVGGNFTGLLNTSDITAPVPAKMFIDYIKVSQWHGKGEVAFNGGGLMANAGSDMATPDLDKNGNELVTLNGSASYGNISTFNWSESGVQLATGKNPTLTLPVGTHFIQLTVTGPTGLTATDEVKVEIREILWDENFQTFNSNHWNVIEGNGCPDLCGWGNGELEYYKPENISIKTIDGEPGNTALAIEAKKETVDNNQFTSGKVTTQNNVNIKYGLLEVRMKAPSDLSTGLWPAAWLLGNNITDQGWPKCGEIDMMEMGQTSQFRIDKGLAGSTENDVVGANLIFYSDAACSGSNPTCAASIAHDNYYCKPYRGSTPITDRFLIYRTYWDQNQIRLTAEDNGVEHDLYTGPFPLGSDAEEFHKPFYFILNLAVGGNFTDATTVNKVTAELPGTMLIDYIRVMKWNGKGEVSFASGLIADAGSDIIKLDSDGDGKETVILDGSNSTDHNGNIVIYSWKLNGNELATGQTKAVEFRRGTYSIELTVTDNEGNSASDIVIVTISNGGAAPVANAGNDTTIYETDDDDLVIFALDGSKSEATNAPISEYKWFENESEIANGIQPTVTLSTGLHLITLWVMDEDSLTATDEVRVTVIDTNNVPPLANAGMPISVFDNDGDDLEIIALDGAGSYDLDGTIAAYRWLVENKEIATGIHPEHQFSTGHYLITLEVTDNDGAVAFAQVSATIIDPDNMKPNAVAGTDTLIIDEDIDGIAEYMLDGSASTDSDGTIEGYNWYDHNNLLASGIKPSVELNAGYHTIRLETTDDDGDTGIDTAIIIVNQLPVAIAGNDTLMLDADNNGNETLVLDASKSYDPNGQILDYVWDENETELANGVSAPVTFEIGTHLVTLKVKDNNGSQGTSIQKVIIARPANIAPTANAGNDMTVEDTDNNGSELINLDGSNSSDSDGNIFSFTWYDNGNLIAESALAEVNLAVGEHIILLEITDNEGAKATDQITITVKKGACLFEACTGDFTSKVISNGDGNFIQFIPKQFGIGETLCLLYYGTTDPMPGYNVTPYSLVKLNGTNAGQNIQFYYTYSTSTSEKTTVNCKQNFTVGSCEVLGSYPMADAGQNQTVTDADNNGWEMVTLSGAASSDADGTIEKYMWIENNAILANEMNPTVKLLVGAHTINMLATDNDANTSRDNVTITVKAFSAIDENEIDKSVHVYPNPVNDKLQISCTHQNIQKLALFNLQGIKLLETEESSQVDMGAFSNGTYILEVTIDETRVKKIIVKK